MPPRRATRRGTKEIFLTAVKENNLKEVEDWISTVDINMIDETDNNNTPLIIATNKDYREMVELLLSKNANPNIKNSNGNIALSYAALNGNVNIAKILIDADSEINIQNDEVVTPLIIATDKGSKEMVELLLSKNADPNIKNRRGNIALSYAAFNGNVEIAKMLIDADSDINNQSHDGETPLILATIKGYKDIVELLLSKNADTNIKDSKGGIALSYAVFNGNVEIAKMLIGAGSDINSQTHQGATPLFIAILKGHLEIAKRLIDAGADVNIISNAKDSPLTVASYNGFLDIVQLLITKGANINHKTKAGYTSLALALDTNHTNVAKILIDAGADINIQFPNGDTALLMAVRKQNTEIVKKLIDVGANINVTNDKNGETALLIAAQKGSEDIVKLLLEKKPLLIDEIKNGIKQKTFKPEIIELLAAHYTELEKPTPWKGQTRGNIEKFDTIFESEEAMRNWSFCPICLGWIPRVDGCMYMKHKCTDMPYYHDKLYKKYKNRIGEICWCTICGRICTGHYHYPIVDADAAEPKPLLLINTNPFERDCRVSNGGGGLPEKIARIRQLRETARELQDDVGKISHEEAMNTLVEDAWNAAKLTGTRKLQRIEATKTWNIPATNFPANVATSAVANVVTNANDPTKYSAPVVLSPGTGAAAEGRNAGYEYNSISYADDIPLIVFKHKDKDGNEHIHPQIGKDSLLADLMTSEKRGKCFDADCGGLLYPREIELAFADPKLAPTVTEEDRKTLAKYKEWFNKWRAEDAKTGGRRRRRSTRRGRKAPKRTRNTRRR